MFKLSSQTCIALHESDQELESGSESRSFNASPSAPPPLNPQNNPSSAPPSNHQSTIVSEFSTSPWGYQHPFDPKICTPSYSNAQSESPPRSQPHVRVSALITGAVLITLFFDSQPTSPSYHWIIGTPSPQVTIPLHTRVPLQVHLRWPKEPSQYRMSVLEPNVVIINHS
jgi:hypothetical protein